MDRRFASVLVLSWTLLPSSCKPTGSAPTDASANDAPADVADAAEASASDAHADVADASVADSACPPDDASFDAGTCVVDSGAPDDGAPDDAPFCCNEDMCQQTGAVCNANTCRCERGPCDGAPPGPGTSCGPWCDIFGEACSAGMMCSVQPPNSTGMCWPRSTASPEGTRCNGSQSCADGLVCYAPTGWLPSVCTRPDCGLSAGAPSCPPGTFCDPIDTLAQMGVCRVRCGFYDEATPCAVGEMCIARGSGGVCVKVGAAPLPRAGEACDSTIDGAQMLCAPGAVCANGLCAEACDPRAWGPGAPGTCPAGRDCVPAYDGGICAPPCDPFSAAPSSECGAGYACDVETTPCGTATGHCMPVAWGPGLGETCWYGYCGTGLVCFGSASPQCVRPCLVDAKPCQHGACAAGEHCFALLAEDSFTQRGYGACAPPCTVGAADCADAGWCEPHELDPATNGWIGVCQ